ncbi:MAG TPA: DUF4340 domain-containing protein [Xanthomonadales bacterium]|nr:DUF4340 domain-containing protein [Xanthomonadales bacterium]
MDRQKRNTWILVGVVVILGLAAVAEQVRERRTAPKPLLGASLRDVNTIALDCPGCPPRRFERVQGAWQMTQPYDAPADPAAIARILQLPRAPVAMRYPVEHFELAKIGLDKPLLVAQLGPYRFEFGGLDALNNLRYVRIGSTVALLADQYSGTLMATPEVLLDKRPFARLRDIAGVAQDGVEWGAERIAALPAMVAQGVVEHPPGASAAAFEVRYARDHVTRYSLERDGSRWLLRHAGEPLAFVLGDAEAAALGAPRRH